MSDQLITQFILAWENFLSGCGFGEPAKVRAMKRGWIDAEGKPTDDGKQLLAALTSQSEQRSVFRNLI